MANLATINNNLLADSGIDPINLIVGTGTVNYVPKFTAEGTIGNSIIQDNGTSITVAGGITAVGIISTSGTGLLASLRIANTTASTGRDWHLYSLNNGNFGLYNNTDASYAYQVTTSGNFGLGVIPAAWRNIFNAFQIGYTGVLYALTTSNATEQVNLASNYYQNSAGNELRVQAGYSTKYQQASGQHIWSTAGTAAAGSGITYTQAMTLKATSQLQLNQYGSGTFTGTVAYNLAVDSSGNIIEVTDGGGTVTGTGVTNRLTYWSGTSTIGYLDTASYPSLTEISYVKGVTSAIQTQLDTKAPKNATFTDANLLDQGGFFTGYNPTNIPSGQTGGDWGVLNAPMWSNYYSGERYTFQFAANLDNNANVFVRKFRYFGSVLQSTWYTLLNSGNYGSYALPLTGGTLSGPLTLSYTNARLTILDGTNRLDLGQWDGVNNRIESGGRPLYMVSYGGTISIGRSSGTNLVVDTSSVTYGSSSFTTAGLFTGTSLDISGQSLLGIVKYAQSPYKVYRNLARIDNYNAGTGALAITTNIPWDGTNMLTIQIKGYRYGATPFDITVACYAGEGNFHNPGYITNSDGIFNGQLYFYRNASDKLVLVLGDPTSAYQIQLWVSEFKQGFNNQNTSFSDGWTITRITSLTGLTNGVTIPNASVTGGIFNGGSITGTTITGTSINGGSISGTSISGTSGTFTGTGSGTSNTIVKVINTTTANALINFENTLNGFSFGFSSTGAAGQRFVFINGAPTEVAYITSAGSGVFSSIVKTGGTSSQFLMADGSVNTSVSPTGSYLPLSGGTLTGPLSGTSATFTGTFRVNQIGQATTPANTSGWRKIGLINDRGGGRLVMSMTGGNYNAVTYVVDYYKDWGSSGTLKLEKYGDPSYITDVRIRQDSANSLYYIEINCASDPNGLEFLVYDIQILGYNGTSTLYTGALVAGSATGTTITTSTFINKGTTVQQFRNEGATTLADSLSGTSASFSSSVTASSFVKTGGTSSQFLMADGSVNTSVSPTGSYLPLTGGTLTGPLDGTTATFSGQLISSTTNGATSAIFRNTGAQNSNGIELRGGTGGTAVNWKLEKDNTVGNAFQITPSTTNGGTTYSTPVFTLTSAGAGTFTGTISASNFSGTHSGSSSGTNTGDQTLSGLGGAPNNASFGDANAPTTGGFFTGFNATNVPSGLSSLDMGLCNMPLWGGNNASERYTMQLFSNLDGNANFYIRKFRYYGSVLQSTWYILLHSGNYSSYALPLSGGTLTGDLTASGSGRRITISDGTNSLTTGLWDGANVRLEGAGRPMYMVSYGGTVSIGRSSGTNLVVDTSTVTYGSCSMSSAGQFTGSNLDISNNSLLNKVKYTQYGYRVYRNLARFDNYNNGTGAIAVYTNIPWDAANMLTIQLKGFRYGDRPFDITVACYAGEGNFYSPGYFSNSANAIFPQYAWYRDGNNKVVLVLGSTSGTYGVQIWAAEYKQGFGGQDPTYADGWSIGKITTTTGLSTGVSIPEKTYTGGVFNGESVTASTVTASGTGSGVFNSQIKAVNTGSGAALIEFSNTANGFCFGFASSGGQRFVWQNGAPTEIMSLNASGQLTASAFFESSDRRIKDLVEDNYKAVGIELIKPRLYKKNGILELGYYAQDFEDVLPSSVYIDDKGFLNLSYTQVHTAKIAYLEDSIEEIKAKILYLENQLKNK